MRLFARDLSVLLDAIVDAVFIHPFPVQGRLQPFVFVNEAACHLLGYSRESLQEMTVNDLDGSAGALDIPAIVKDLARGVSRRFEQQFIRSDGSLVAVEIQAVLREHEGTRFIVSAVRDMTRRKADEALLRHREELLELFFRQSLDGFFFMMLDEPVDWAGARDRQAVLDYVLDHHRITRVNQAFLDQYGASEADVMGSTPRDFFAHDLEYGRGVWEQFFDVGRLHVDTTERRLDGTEVVIEGDYICLYDEAGRITGHFGVQRDVTARDQGLALLRLQRDVATALAEALSLHEACEAVLDAVLSVSGVDCGGVYLVTGAGSLELAAARGLSESFVRASTSYPPDSPHAQFALSGEPMYARYDQHDMGEVRRGEGLRAMASIPVHHGEETVALVNAASRGHDDLATSTRRALEAVAAQVGGAIARLQAMEQKEQAELRAATQEMLLREVNHRVKNNLSAIMGILHLEEDKAHQTGGVPTAEVISSVVGRVRGLAKVHELASQHRWQPILVTELCERVIHGALPVATQEIAILIPPSPAVVGAHKAHHLALVLNELLTNSLKYAHTPLEVGVSTASTDAEITLVYRDDGPGYPDEILSGRGYGTGLELAFGIVGRSLRGRLVLDNDEGARATLCFPIGQES